MPCPFSSRFALITAALLLPLAAHAAPPATATYVVNNHAGKITITNADGKTLYAGQAATPAVQIVFTHGPDNGTKASLNLPPFLTLEDASSTHLWAAHIPGGPHFNLTTKADTVLTGLKFTFTSIPHTPARNNTTEPKRVAFTLGTNDAVTAINKDGKINKFIQIPNGLAMNTSQAPAVSVQRIPFTPNYLLTVNGTTMIATPVDLGNKHYYSIPWYGHPVLVEDGNNFVLSSAGELIINAPKPAK